jgi:biotin carboxylase
MDLHGKKLMVLTGCNGAKDIIEYAKKNDVRTIATDYYDVSPIKDLADYRYNISTTDINSLYKIAVKHKVDGITTGTSEASMYSVLELCKRLELPFYASSDQLGTINNKRKLKNLLREFDLPIIREYPFLGNMNDETVKGIRYPVVVKPVDSSGHKGISVCKNEKELTNAYNYALGFSRSKQVLVEKCITGLPETIFNYTIVDGKFSLSCGWDKYIYYENGALIGLPIANIFPSTRIEAFLDNVHLKLTTAFKYIGIKNGTMSIQCFVDGETFYIFEAGYRLGGVQMYIFTQALSGINVMEMMVNYSLTGKMADDPKILEKDNPFFEKPCYQLNIPLKPGRIKDIKGIEEIKAIGGVLNVTEVRKVGDYVKNDGSTSQYCIRIHIVGDTVEDVSDIIDIINSQVVIKDENGEDMILEKYQLK